MTTPASQWQRQAEELELPSGRVVKARKPDLMDILMSEHNGDVPDFLTAQVLAQFKGKKPKKEETDTVDMGLENLTKMGVFIDRVTREAFIEPRISENGHPDYENGEISIHDVSRPDKMFVYNWAMPASETAKAKSFRKEPQPDVEAVPEQ